VKTFTPVGRITQEEETIGEKLQRLARESLPRHPHLETGDRDRNAKRRCVCGEYLPAHPKIREKRPVCDDCADEIPRSPAGRCPSCTCFECRAVLPRRKLKMKNRNLYCKKCLKTKFEIDF